MIRITVLFTICREKGANDLKPVGPAKGAPVRAGGQGEI